MDLQEQVEKLTKLDIENDDMDGESPAGRSLQQSSSSVGLDSVYIAMVTFAALFIVTLPVIREQIHQLSHMVLRTRFNGTTNQVILILSFSITCTSILNSLFSLLSLWFLHFQAILLWF